MVSLPFSSFFGVELIVRPDPMKHVPAWPHRRKWRKRRLIRKWSNRFGYTQVVDEVEAAKIYQVGDKVYCTAVMKQNIIAQLDAR
jgi:hypothetical protein